MEQRRLDEVREQRLEAVHRLEEQEIGDLGDAATPRLTQGRRHRFAALVQQAVQLARVAREGRVLSDRQAGWDVTLVEHHLVVAAALDDPCDADGGVRIGRFGGEHQAQPEPTDLNERRLLRGRAVADAELIHRVALEPCGALAVQIRLLSARTAYGQRKQDEHVLRVDRDLERFGAGAGRREVEGRPVRHDPARRGERELAERELWLVDRERHEAPVVRGEGPGAPFHPRLEVAILLLEVLGLEEQPLRPDDLVRPHVVQFGCDARQLIAEGSTPSAPELNEDRKSTRLNSSHLGISYAVFCLKKKKKNIKQKTAKKRTTKK